MPSIMMSMPLPPAAVVETSLERLQNQSGLLPLAPPVELGEPCAADEEVGAMAPMAAETQGGVARALLHKHPGGDVGSAVKTWE